MPDVRWKLGSLELVRIAELEFPLPRSVLPIGGDPEALAASAPWAKPHFVTEPGDVVFAVSTLGLVSDDRRILVDPCISFDLRRENPDIGERASDFLDTRLPAAGFAPEDVDLVLNTHVDGVGWNVRPGSDAWRPAFPKARHVWSRTEIERVRDEGLPDAESLQPLLDAGVVDTVDAPCQLTPHLTLLPSPGHTPGNVDIWIECDGESAVVVGDQILNPLQCADPDWSGLDMNPAAAPGLRRALLEECEARGTLLIGPHFGSPGAGRVRREGATWRLDPEPASAR